MKFPTIVKKYRIVDYSQLSNLELVLKFEYLSKKGRQNAEKKLDHKYVTQQFSVMLNLHNIMQELYSRFPQLKNAIDFDGEISDILEKNQINASKN